MGSCCKRYFVRCILPTGKPKGVKMLMVCKNKNIVAYWDTYIIVLTKIKKDKTKKERIKKGNIRDDRSIHLSTHSFSPTIDTFYSHFCFLQR